MKVCLLTTAFPRWPGDDRGSFILNAARALVNQGINVRVLSIHSPGAKTHEVMDGIEVVRTRYLPEKNEVLQKEGGGLPAVWKKNPWARLALLPFVVAQIQALARYSQDCDVIHANWTLSGMIAWAAYGLHRRPYIVTVHGSDLYQTRNMWLAKRLTRYALGGAARVVAVSRDLAGIAVSLGIPDGKLCVIPDGIDIERFSPGDADRDEMLLFVGSLIPRKGVIHLLQAFTKVTQVNPRLQLVIAGEGPLESSLKQAAHDFQVEDRVIFLGARRQEDISNLMKRAKVFVLPSLEEGLGVVLLEALASGTPCVASQVGGVPDVVVPGVGLLVSPGDADALAAAILHISSDELDWQEMSRSARRRAVEIYDWRLIADRLISVYQDAVSARIV